VSTEEGQDRQIQWSKEEEGTNNIQNYCPLVQMHSCPFLIRDLSTGL